jgi:hypothetical protein
LDSSRRRNASREERAEVLLRLCRRETSPPCHASCPNLLTAAPWRRWFAPPQGTIWRSSAQCWTPAHCSPRNGERYSSCSDRPLPRTGRERRSARDGMSMTWSGTCSTTTCAGYRAVPAHGVPHPPAQPALPDTLTLCPLTTRIRHIRPTFGEYFGNPLVSCTDDHAHQCGLMLGIEGALIGVSGRSLSASCRLLSRLDPSISSALEVQV